MENNKRLRLFGRMHFIQWLFLTALFSVVAMSGYAQGKTVTGKIIDSTGEPVIGASVLVKGTTNGVISDIDGNFSIQGVANDATLQISFVGYKSQEISVAGKTRHVERRYGDAGRSSGCRLRCPEENGRNGRVDES